MDRSLSLFEATDQAAVTIPDNSQKITPPGPCGESRGDELSAILGWQGAYGQRATETVAQGCARVSADESARSFLNEEMEERVIVRRYRSPQARSSWPPLLPGCKMPCLRQQILGKTH